MPQATKTGPGNVQAYFHRGLLHFSEVAFSLPAINTGTTWWLNSGTTLLESSWNSDVQGLMF